MPPPTGSEAGAGPAQVGPGAARSATLTSVEGHGARAGTEPGGTPHLYRALVDFDDRLRAASDELELCYRTVNELRALVQARQVFIAYRTSERQYRVQAVSSLALIDRDTPLVRWIEGLMAKFESEHSEQPAHITLAAREGHDAQMTAGAKAPPEDDAYPFRHLLWQPLHLAKTGAFATLLVARETPWSEAERKLVERQAQMCALALAGLRAGRKLRVRSRAARWLRRMLIPVAIVLAGSIPVPMSALAPVEIVADEPHRITMPIDGIVQKVLVDPGEPVEVGDPILEIDPTQLRNEYRLAERQALVAQARLARTKQAAFSDPKARHEVAIAQTELDLALAEQAYARALLERTTVRAERAGTLIYRDEDQWLGRPIATGELLMYIADPSEVVAKIDLPVASADVLDEHAEVRLFLNADPLRSVGARLRSMSYHASPNRSRQLSYTLFAQLHDPKLRPRLGARGTARISAREVSLAFYLLRRPISSLRQNLGL